jgi:hypothetical protein
MPAGAADIATLRLSRLFCLLLFEHATAPLIRFLVYASQRVRILVSMQFPRVESVEVLPVALLGFDEFVRISVEHDCRSYSCSIGIQILLSE